MKGRPLQCACATSVSTPLQLLCVRAGSDDHGAQLAETAVSTAFNAVDLERSRRDRLPAAVKYGGAGASIPLTSPLP